MFHTLPYAKAVPTFLKTVPEFIFYKIGMPFPRFPWESFHTETSAVSPLQHGLFRFAFEADAGFFLHCLLSIINYQSSITK